MMRYIEKTVVDFITDDQHNIDSVPPFEIVFIEDFFKTSPFMLQYGFDNVFAVGEIFFQFF